LSGRKRRCALCEWHANLSLRYQSSKQQQAERKQALCDL